MEYTVELKRTALKDLAQIDKKDADAILKKIYSLRKGLVGDIKKLKNYNPGYRLRVGNYRVLFELEGLHIEVANIFHRKEAYKHNKKVQRWN